MDYTLKQAEAYTGLKYKTLYHHIYQTRSLAYKSIKDGKILVDKAELDRFMTWYFNSKIDNVKANQDLWKARKMAFEIRSFVEGLVTSADPKISHLASQMGKISGKISGYVAAI